MKTFNPFQPKGKRVSLRGIPATPTKGTYLISLSAKEDARPFGSNRGRTPILNERGKALKACWLEFGKFLPGIRPDEVQVTSRRLEGILSIDAEEADAPSLSETVRLFKVLSSLRLAQIGKSTASPDGGTYASIPVLRGKSAAPLWKKGFAERALGGESDLAAARKILRGGP